MHASQFLTQPDKYETGPMVAIFGTERFLRQAARVALRQKVLGSPDADPTIFSGKTATLGDVLDELSMISMWGDRRLVIVEDADDFVSNNRAALEKFLDKPAKKSVLVLEVKTWAKTTRLAKAVDKIGLSLSCEELKGKDLFTWINHLIATKYEKKISRDASALLEQLVGNNLALLEQEIGKVASYVGDRQTIEQDDVRTLVGGWKVETTWKMLDELREGRVGHALELLDDLLASGEAPLKLLGGITFVFRKYIEAAEIARNGCSLNDALKQAKVFPRDIAPTARFMRRIGRPNAEKILTRIMQADGEMKGRSTVASEIRIERLLVELSGAIPAEPQI